ncbi:TolC family protein [Butyricimonas paravirosa]|uniref:TolC family protein n=1 Tax=Butyricimonas paravirosa TaxID=1472417 RepID=UPI00210D69F1|nr:TolC family protein [Butyricimonas paravirosa]MCQ4874679.1 TolC family protein [Butyricimonas paravirosa]
MMKQKIQYKGMVLKSVLLLFIFNFQLSIFNCHAQQRVSLDECLEKALESNFSIKIIRNEARMDKNNLNYSTFLPTLEANAKQTQTRNDSKTENSAGEVNKVSDMKTDNYTAGVALNWRLFDGLEMFTTHEKQKELLAMGELAVQQAVENLIVNVSSAYYNVLVQHHKLIAVRHSLEISTERYEEAQVRYQIKNLSGLEARQAKIDLNSDSSAYMRQREALKSAYITLNKLMNADLQLVNYVQDTILLGAQLALGTLEAKTLQGNTTLLMARKDQRISALDLKNTRAVLFPTLDFSSGYNYNKTDSPSSNNTLNRTNGFYWGFSLNVPIFNRLQNRTKIKNAKLELENTELSYQEVEKETLGDLALLYNTYENNLLMVNFEIESADVAEANLDAALQKYKLGSLSGIEFREFQRSYIDAVDRKLSALYQAKVSELSLLLISGEIRNSLVIE